MAEKRPPGRPRIYPKDDVPRISMTMSASADLYRRIEAACERSGLSLGREMERRIEASFLIEDTGRALVETVRAEMRAEFEARREFSDSERKWLKEYAAANELTHSWSYYEKHYSPAIYRLPAALAARSEAHDDGA